MLMATTMCNKRLVLIVVFTHSPSTPSGAIAAVTQGCAIHVPKNCSTAAAGAKLASEALGVVEVGPHRNTLNWIDRTETRGTKDLHILYDVDRAVVRVSHPIAVSES